MLVRQPAEITQDEWKLLLESLQDGHQALVNILRMRDNAPTVLDDFPGLRYDGINKVLQERKSPFLVAVSEGKDGDEFFLERVQMS